MDNYDNFKKAVLVEQLREKDALIEQMITANSKNKYEDISKINTAVWHLYAYFESFLWETLNESEQGRAAYDRIYPELLRILSMIKAMRAREDKLINKRKLKLDLNNILDGLTKIRYQLRNNKILIIDANDVITKEKLTKLYNIVMSAYKEFKEEVIANGLEKLLDPEGV